MADGGVQLASAVVSLVEAIRVTYQITKKLCRAQTSARELYRKVERLSIVIEDIRRIVEDQGRPQFIERISTREVDVRNSALKCIEDCQTSLGRLNEKLGPLANNEAIKVVERLKFVFAEKAIKYYENDIESQFQNLTLSLVSLNTVNHAITHDNQQIMLYILFRCMANQRPTSPTEEAQYAADISVLDEIRRQIPGLLEPSSDQSINGAPLLTQYTVTEAQFSSADNPVSADEESVQEVLTEDDVDQPQVNMPLVKAVKIDEASIVQCLVHRGADITFVDSDGWTLLHHATFNGSYNALCALLKDNNDQVKRLINIQNPDGQTALMLAAEQAYNSVSLQLAEKLICSKYGCDTNIKNHHGRTALFIVIEQTPNDQREEFAKLLIRNGADVEHVTSLQNARKYSATTDVIDSAVSLSEEDNDLNSPTRGEGSESIRRSIGRRLTRTFSRDPE